LNETPDIVNALFNSISILKAQEALFQLKLSDYPTMKPEARTKLFKDLKREAYPETIKEESRALTTADLAKFLNRG